MPDIPRRRFKYTHLSEVFQLDLETAHGDLLIGNTSGICKPSADLRPDLAEITMY
jgi:hypothetical protein